MHFTKGFGSSSDYSMGEGCVEEEGASQTHAFPKDSGHQINLVKWPRQAALAWKLLGFLLGYLLGYSLGFLLGSNA